MNTMVGQTCYYVSCRFPALYKDIKTGFYLLKQVKHRDEYTEALNTKTTEKSKKKPQATLDFFASSAPGSTKYSETHPKQIQATNKLINYIF